MPTVSSEDEDVVLTAVDRQAIWSSVWTKKWSPYTIPHELQNGFLCVIALST